MPNSIMQDNNVYVNVYFRVNAGYVWSQGMDDEQLERFNAEVSHILEGVGFEMIPPKMSAGCYKAVRGVESLHCHPMDLSGYVKETAIDGIKTALEQAKAFTLRGVDTYERVCNYTENEFLAALKEKEEDITKQILEAFVTKSKNLFMPARTIEKVCSGLKYFRNGVGTAPLEQMEVESIQAEFKRLVESGKITTATGRHGQVIYRTVPEPKSKARRKAGNVNQDNLLPLLS